MARRDAGDRKNVAERLTLVRGNRSQRKFAKELGVFQQNLSRYERGALPHAEFLILLHAKEKVSIDWLLTGKGRMRRGRQRGPQER